MTGQAGESLPLLITMKKGQTIAFVRGSESPRKSNNTKLVAAAIACGIPPSGKNFFSDTIEEVDGKSKRQVTWTMDASGPFATFAPIKKEESLDFLEFQRRFTSREWCEANPDHPIAYMHAYTEHLNRLGDKLRTLKPMLLMRKGKRTAIVPSGSSAAETAKREEILAKF